MKTGYTTYKIENIKDYDYLRATGVKIDSVSEQELMDYCMELNKVRNEIIDDLLFRLTSNYYSKNTYATEINNPQSYYMVFKDLIELKDYFEELVLNHFKRNNFKMDKLMPGDKYYFERDKAILIHTKKRIEILRLLFDKYCETDWRKVI